MSGMGSISWSEIFTDLNDSRSASSSSDDLNEPNLEGRVVSSHALNTYFVPNVGYQFTFRDTPYQLINVVGRGTSKRVFSAQPVSIPANKDSEISRFSMIAVLFSSIHDAKSIERVERETHILEKVKDIPGCLRMLEPPQRVGQSEVQMITNFCGGGTLDSWAEGQPFPARLRKVLQVAIALQCLHSLGIGHGDVKSENIVIDEEGNATDEEGNATDEEGRATLADFGSATEDGNDRTGDYLGSQAYLPPGRIINSILELDVFALGAVLFEMTTRRIEPGLLLQDVSILSGRNQNWVTYRFCTTQEDIDRAIAKLPDHPIKGLLVRMLIVNPERRIKINEVVCVLREIVESNHRQMVLRENLRPIREDEVEFEVEASNNAQELQESEVCLAEGTEDPFSSQAFYT